MDRHQKLLSAFDIPKGHTPKVILAGATTQKIFEPVWKGRVPDDRIEDMDEHASKKGYPYSPVLALVYQGENHSHIQMSVPLENWAGEVKVDEAMLKTNDVRRISDWMTGFMNSFCADDSISSIDLTTGLPILEGTNSAVNVSSIEQIVKKPEDVRLEPIGDVDAILNAPKTEEEEAQKETERVEKIRKQQQEVVDKFGWEALEDLTKRTKQTIIIEKP